MATALDLTPATWKAMFPHAPQAILDGLFAQQHFLEEAGLLSKRVYFTYCFANCGEETGGFAIPNLTESSAYTPSRAAQVWPGRFRNGTDAQAKVAGAPGSSFGEKLFNTVYASRMGNGSPSTGDGFAYRGRGGPQLTGRDEYGLIQNATSLPLLAHPEQAGQALNQDQIIGAYWTTKHLAVFADAGNFTGLVRKWNGGTIGLTDRVAYLNRITPIISRVAMANHIDNVLDGDISNPIDEIDEGQAALNKVRLLYDQQWLELVVDNTWGPNTRAATIAYQSWAPPWREESLAKWGDQTLDVDGLFGPKTYAALMYDISHAPTS